MARSAEELFRAQLAAMNAADLDRLMADYAEDAVMVNGERRTEGKPAIRALYAAWLSPDSQVVLDEIRHEGGESHFYWTSTTTAGGARRVTRGHDTLEIAGDRIKKQIIYVLP
jgi:ketosteroid isomerase-like protein